MTACYQCKRSMLLDINEQGIYFCNKSCFDAYACDHGSSRVWTIAAVAHDFAANSNYTGSSSTGTKEMQPYGERIDAFISIGSELDYQFLKAKEQFVDFDAIHEAVTNAMVAHWLDHVEIECSAETIRQCIDDEMANELEKSDAQELEISAFLLRKAKEITSNVGQHLEHHVRSQQEQQTT